jgi:phosphomannomutase
MNPSSTEIPHELRQQVTSWIDDDVCESSKGELRALLSASNAKELRERMAGPLEFGTAGLRGELGAGQNRMNLAVVIRSTAGIAEYLVKTEPAAPQRGVVIGHDARRMGREFAEAAASVFAAYGIPVYLFPTFCPTPLVAYACTRLNAVSSIMITASHNPPQYNGMKVYWGNGAQIIPPHDAGMAAAIAAMPGAKDCKRLDVRAARERGLVQIIEDSLLQQYLEDVSAASLHSASNSGLSIVYTPLHGVGKDLTLECLRRVGCETIAVVEEQAEPDGSFPTVSSPNPEDTSALTMALELASQKNADIILANDPDADRLAVCALDKVRRCYVHLNGNQVGALIAQYLLEQPHLAGPNCLYITSIVSSPMLKTMAEENAVLYEEVLPGFKWIANKAMSLEKQQNARFVFGYEEAIGYTVGTLVRDKDGVSAAAIFGELASFYARKGVSILEKLQQLYRRYGLFTSAQHSITRPGLQGANEIATMMRRLREEPPTKLAGIPVTTWTDYSQGARYHHDGAQSSIDLPRSDTVSFELENSSRVTARPSGTEPKIKFYFDVRESIGSSEAFDAASSRAATMVENLKADFLSILQRYAP